MSAIFNNSNYNWALPTLSSPPVNTDTPAPVPLYGTRPQIANPNYSQSAADAAQQAMDDYNSQQGYHWLSNDEGYGYSSNPGPAPAAYNVPKTIEGPVYQAPPVPQVNPQIPANWSMTPAAPVNPAAFQPVAQTPVQYGTSTDLSHPREEAPAQYGTQVNLNPNGQIPQFNVNAFISTMLGQPYQAATTDPAVIQSGK